ncbi:T3SS effector HopA1 family protein [Dolichospermum sp. UHCC 0259]|uniref:T3SS effector HopA1 family protein n=1 Tax=Dolichospermum sp. UHCC 0259 TaxID=2590010 RepID=UPI001446F9AF|nr:T3SS effector HopA1 family protein [Dolichospermum sp. UHCC 0259]MTJ47573.1 hypothetical protein [Dolichospermum sp. UHCC 0259]
MQLLDSPQNQSIDSLNWQLLDVLQDIVHKIEISSNFSISHPDYKPLELPIEVVERFQQMPAEMQQKYLSLQLRSFLYGIYYNGSMQSALALDGEGNGLPLDLENNTILGIDVGFYEQLHESNCGEGYFDHGWSVIKEEIDGSLVVTKGGLKIHIQREKHLQCDQKNAVVGEVVAIRLPKNLLQNGFYMAVGNQGLNHEISSQQITVRIYFNLIPEATNSVMRNLTKKLNELAIPFSFKVLYNPKDYGRHDSGVLYFDKNDYDLVKEVLQVVYAENKLSFQPEVPLFSLQLAPGLGLAEEPNQKFAQKESFGMNRCQIVANGLLKAWYQGDNSPAERMELILESFSILGIDVQRTYLNANSEDIYQLLNQC